MKKKSILMAGIVTLLFAGCTSETQVEQPEVSIPIEFGTYVGNRQVTTRAEMTTATLKEKGFGLFVTYSTGSGTTDGTYAASDGPNFMYNQKVSAPSSGEFSYTPVKYWPNETKTDGTTNGATSSHKDVLSFFAYAPHVVNAEASGDDNVADGTLKEASTSGITGITANNATTDPKVTYTLPSRTGSDEDPAEVDLLWGVVPAETTSWSNVSGTAVTLTPGLPYLNLVKPNTTQKIVLSFKHALAKLTFGTIALANDVVGVSAEGNANVASGTSIVVSEISLSGTGIGKGILNLNNTEAGVPLWEAATTPGTASFYAKVSGDQLAEAIKDAGAKKTQPTGVTKTAQSILASSTTAPGALLIPSSSQSVTVKIKYYTVTKDGNLLNGESRVENEIEKTLTGLNLAGSKAYKINIVIGMTSIKVDATVDDTWGDAGSQDVDLPANKAS